MSNLGPSFDRAQRVYEAQLPTDDDELLRECDQCGEEYAYEVEIDDDTGPHVVSNICDKCKELNENGPQT